MEQQQQGGRNRGKKKPQGGQQHGGGGGGDHSGGGGGGQGKGGGGGKKGQPQQQGQSGDQQQQQHQPQHGQGQQQGQGQGKGKYKQKQQQQQQQPPQAQPPSAPAGGSQQYGDFLQKMQQQQQVAQPAPAPAPAQGEPPKQAQGQQQKGGGGGGKYKQKQQQKQQEQQELEKQLAAQRPQQPPAAAHSRSPSSPEGSLSPTHGAIQRVEEDLSGMKIDKGSGKSALRQVLIRPGAHGRQGKVTKLEVNYIPLMLEKMVSTAYHYDVDIQPMASRKWQRAAFKRFEVEALAGQPIAFDGNKNAYTAKKLKLDHYKKEVVAREDNRDRKFTITMKEAAVVDLQCLKNYMQAGSGNANLVKPMRAIQCLDVVLRTAYELNPRFVKFRKSIYVVPSKPEDIGANHELWYGLFQSALLGSKPFLNIDVSHKAFPRGGPVLDVVASLNRNSLPTTLAGWLAQQVHDYLKGMEVVYTGPNGVGKTFKYNSLKGPASTQKFKLEDGSESTVAAYFQKQGVRLRFPDLPVMHVGSTIRNIMVPMELCAVPPGQALIKKHPDQCTQMIIRRSATDTVTRKGKIMDIFNQIDYNNCKTIKDFGFGVGNSFEVVDGRIIGPPSVLYRNNVTITPSRGQWRADNASFIQINPQPLRWRILNLDDRTRPAGIQQFGQNIFQVSRKHGIQLEPFSMQQTYYEPRDLRYAIREVDSIFEDLKKQRMDFVIVVISGMGDQYSKVKQRAELVTGLLTQCIKGDTVFKKAGDMSTINNIWLKINAKTNGTNHVLKPECKPPLIRKRVMYVGADVTHPSPEQTNIPSVVGVAASYDLEGFRYNCCYRLQNPKDEMIRDLENIIKKQLLQFKTCNGALPDLIMYYRDGVSEGQFSEILTIELNAIQSAVASTSPGVKVAVTFIVVQKRHHARFFPTRGTIDVEGRNKNLPPGTVVDKHITAPNQYQFFLISHQAVQGVAKPTKYCVLYDDVNSDPDELQAVTYALCHMFARCNRAVSYPAPTYYAHLAAFRGRVYIKDRRLNMNDLAGEYRKMQIKPEIIDGHPMFFV